MKKKSPYGKMIGAREAVSYNKLPVGRFISAGIRPLPRLYIGKRGLRGRKTELRGRETELRDGRAGLRDGMAGLRDGMAEVRDGMAEARESVPEGRGVNT